MDEHHKDRDHNNGGANVVKLCPNCHADIHRRGRVLDPVRPGVQPKDQLPPGAYVDADGNVVYD